MLLIFDDMLVQFLHYECRVELHVAKANGGYNDIIATRIQSAFRMCVERRKYTLHQRVRNSAVRHPCLRLGGIVILSSCDRPN